MKLPLAQDFERFLEEMGDLETEVTNRHIVEATTVRVIGVKYLVKLNGQEIGTYLLIGAGDDILDQIYEGDIPGYTYSGPIDPYGYSGNREKLGLHFTHCNVFFPFVHQNPDRYGKSERLDVHSLIPFP